MEPPCRSPPALPSTAPCSPLPSAHLPARTAPLPSVSPPVRTDDLYSSIWITVGSSTIVTVEGSRALCHRSRSVSPRLQCGGCKGLAHPKPMLSCTSLYLQRPSPVPRLQGASVPCRTAWSPQLGPAPIFKALWLSHHLVILITVTQTHNSPGPSGRPAFQSKSSRHPRKSIGK